MKRKIVAFIGYQRFRCIGRKRRLTKDGRKIWLLIIQSHCPDCGKRFEVKTTKIRLKTGGSLNRRCPGCKKTGEGHTRNSAGVIWYLINYSVDKVSNLSPQREGNSPKARPVATLI